MSKEITPDNFRFRHLPWLIMESAKAWNRDDPWRLSAVVAYYALLAIPGLMVIIINLVGVVWGEDIVQDRVLSQIAVAIGEDAATTIRDILRQAQEEAQDIISTIIGLGTLIFGATGVFYHMQISINHIWEIKPAPDAGFKKILIDRLLSFAFVLVIGFLLLISFVITTAIGFMVDYLRQIWPDFAVYLAIALNELVSLGVVTMLFALMYRFLPDAKIRWRTVWVGAIITALLFTLGKFLMGLYFGQANPVSMYGAAGSIVLILLWVSYSSLIFFFGAEFTFVFARRYGFGIHPKPHAWRVKKKEEVVERGSQSKKEGEADNKGSNIM